MSRTLFHSRGQTKSRTQRGQGRSDSGQIIVEYILLLVVGVAIAVGLTTMMVSRNEDSPGFVIEAWRAMIVAISSDSIDEIE